MATPKSHFSPPLPLSLLPLPFSFSFFLLLFVISLLQSPLSMAADTISPAQPLSGIQMLVSKGGKFALGFFQPVYSSPPQKWYIGIWYNTVVQRTVVWVANRETPVTNPFSSQLAISDHGDLVLLDQSKSPIWSAGANATSNSTVAVILDTGNLVLRDGSNSSRVFWQSMDHPTDTFLPGGKLGLNKLTGVSQRLFSWKSPDDPAPGIYSLEIDPNGTSQFFIEWNKTQLYWTSGTWNGEIFSDVPEMTENYIYTFEYVSNPTENYFTYSLKNDSIISRFIIHTSGQIRQLTWVDEDLGWILFWAQPRAPGEVFDFCGPFGTCNQSSSYFCNCNCMKGFSPKYPSYWSLGVPSGGCVRNTRLSCGVQSSTKKEKDKFYEMNSVRLPDNAQSLGGGGGGGGVGSVDDCESICLRNCSCTAYSYGGGVGGCLLWYGDLVNLQEQYNGTVDGGALYLRLAASEFPSSKSREGLIVGVVTGGIVAFLALLAIVITLIRRQARRRPVRLSKAATGGALTAFRYRDLRRATKNFSEKLGGGSFGSVFQGLLPDSTAIAVKKLDGLHQGEKQFRAEVSTLGTIQHVNLIRLFGFCSEGTRRLLVYEYMPKGSLDVQLFRNNSEVLSWKTRYQIALGAARGLAYLHEKCRYRIIHCDVKPENVLLDSSFVPKVADFGLAKLMGRDFSRVLTTIRGTRGYLAPEWIAGVAITAKADVHSYGMMLFEIISGRRNSERGGEGGGKSTFFFPSLAAKELVEGDVRSLLDPKLDGNADIEELERACKVACWCIQDDESSRPTMGRVVQILEGFLEINMPPIPRWLQVLGDDPDSDSYFFDVPTEGSSTRSAASASSHSGSASGREL